MLDSHAITKEPIPRIDVVDYIEMGRIVTEWAIDPASRPETMDELRKQLDGIAAIPARISSFEMVQGTLEHLVIPLPVKEIIDEGVERACDPMNDGRSPLPQFYADHFLPGFGPVMTPLDTLLARVGDFAIAQCR